MSYDLDFWKYKNDVYLDNQLVYEKCSDGEIVEGLEDLPIEFILKDIVNEFKEWKSDSDGTFFENVDGDGAFEIYYNRQFVRFDCYGMYDNDLNRLIDVMLKYDSPLYDPQVGQRFDGR